MIRKLAAAAALMSAAVLASLTLSAPAAAMPTHPGTIVSSDNDLVDVTGVLDGLFNGNDTDVFIPVNVLGGQIPVGLF